MKIRLKDLFFHFASLGACHEARLESDLGYRFGYVAELMGFGPEDAAMIHVAAPHLAPLLPDQSALFPQVHTVEWCPTRFPCSGWRRIADDTDRTPSPGSDPSNPAAAE